MNTDDVAHDEQGRIIWPGGGYYDDDGRLHFPDTDALDAAWAKRQRRVLGGGVTNDR